MLSATSEGAADGWTLSLEHAAVARAGLDVPFTATVTHDGGFEKTITLAVTGDYFDIYETQGFNPEPQQDEPRRRARCTCSSTRRRATCSS